MRHIGDAPGSGDYGGHGGYGGYARRAAVARSPRSAMGVPGSAAPAAVRAPPHLLIVDDSRHAPGQHAHLLLSRAFALHERLRQSFVQYERTRPVSERPGVGARAVAACSITLITVFRRMCRESRDRVVRAGRAPHTRTEKGHTILKGTLSSGRFASSRSLAEGGLFVAPFEIISVLITFARPTTRGRAGALYSRQAAL
ncbi:hypothetical protein EVAR_48096_1 [Eumeta japonica]|uniref:Uncharacterized protein n=1 Tax=Eumeta variegata TaxID=151549 RepID=A0A4C1XK89_EUMVA|nr:hypothetical protein EVAR_48096_1 [Eumeta japonica]